MTHSLVARFLRPTVEPCTRKVSGDPAGTVRVTPDPATSVTDPDPIRYTSTTVPTGKATLEFGGTVTVVADAEFISITSPASDKTRV